MSGRVALCRTVEFRILPFSEPAHSKVDWPSEGSNGGCSTGMAMSTAICNISRLVGTFSVFRSCAVAVTAGWWPRNLMRRAAADGRYAVSLGASVRWVAVCSVAFAAQRG